MNSVDDAVGGTLHQAARTLLEPGASGEVEARVAACARLAGAVGRGSIEALVAALHDRSRRVREAAVAALAVSAATPGHGLRLVHAAMHPRADVRALAIATTTLPAALLVELIADPAVSTEALGRAVARIGDDPAILPAVLRARRRGVLDDDATRTVLRAAPWGTRATSVLRAVPGKAPTGGVATVAALTRAAAAVEVDALVDVVALAADDDALRRLVVRGLRRAARAGLLDAADRDRLAVAVAVVAAMRGGLPPALLALGLLGGSAVLAWDAIPLEARRAAVLALPRLGLRGRSSTVVVDVATGGLQRGDAPDVPIIAGALWLCAERPWATVLAGVAIAELARAFVVEPDGTLLLLVPDGAPDRAAWRTLLGAVGRAIRSAGDDIVFNADSWRRALAVAPADALSLLDDLDARWPGAPARIAGAAFDDHGPEDDDDDEREQRRLRRRRMLAACVERCGLATRAGLARQVLQRGASSTAMSPGARAVFAVICGSTHLVELAAIIDGLPPALRPLALDVALREAPSVWAPEQLRAPLQAPASSTVLSLARRDAPPEPLDAATAERPWPELATRVLTTAGVLRVAGVAEVVVARAARGDPPPRGARLAAAVLASHDPPHRVAPALALVWPAPGDAVDADDVAAVARVLRAGCPAGLLPFVAHLVVGVIDEDGSDDDALHRLLQECELVPGGVRAILDLILVTQGPWSGLLLERLVAVLARGRARHDRALDALLADGSLRRLLDDVATGALLLPGDPRCGALLALGALIPTTTSLSSSTPPLPPPRRTGVLSLLAAGGAALAAWNADATDDERLAALHEGLADGAIPAAQLWPIARALPAVHRTPIVAAALRGSVATADLEGWLRLMPPATKPPTASERPLTTTARLAAVVADGQREAMVLCGGIWRVSFIADGLGHTRLGTRRICVNPLPLLDEVREGDAIVRGLILHELGHHRFHADPEARQIWQTARDERLHALLNLVADEHLERRLRAMEPQRWGAPLKTLAAWAFQHMHKELAVEDLLASLGPRALAVLTARPLGVARRPDAVVVEVGAALVTMARHGSSFSRFMRALRMGRRDGVADAKVEAALALFPPHTFRASSMSELLAIARRLRTIFGDDTRVLDAFDFHRLTDASADELAAGGVDPVAAEREAQSRAPRQRVRGPRRPVGRGAAAAGGALNVDDDTAFDPIDRVERAVVDVAAHAAVARQVQRPARVLRQHLWRIGTGLVVDRRRLSGRRVDRGALVGSILRGDPRLLSARRHAPAPDVFVGVAIDCSGSMDGDNLERARHFGVLLAEAVRGLPDIEARFIGFTDDTITDAGDARRCAVTSLEAGGGNNDAAALQHLARMARQSRRSTVLLVVISDGAPTECSVPALRTLVDHLTARGMLCAQVAVEAIDDEDICFDHHILLADDDLAGAARRFGVVIEELLATARNHRTRRSPP